MLQDLYFFPLCIGRKRMPHQLYCCSYEWCLMPFPSCCFLRRNYWIRRCASGLTQTVCYVSGMHIHGCNGLCSCHKHNAARLPVEVMNCGWLSPCCNEWHITIPTMTCFPQGSRGRWKEDQMWWPWGPERRVNRAQEGSGFSCTEAHQILNHIQGQIYLQASKQIWF